MSGDWRKRARQKNGENTREREIKRKRRAGVDDLKPSPPAELLRPLHISVGAGDWSGSDDSREASWIYCSVRLELFYTDPRPRGSASQTQRNIRVIMVIRVSICSCASSCELRSVKHRLKPSTLTDFPPDTSSHNSKNQTSLRP
ncbi:hypothetical protein WMY93_023555 [Mugilogobius chulae]|uniref:Uncharacterized protein n=1 Tax=Mugilogobius chulae TaxID=88201 RepID=A0AAW0NA72_9GOBI